jgi:hypothetical protein
MTARRAVFLLLGKIAAECTGGLYHENHFFVEESNRCAAETIRIVMP